MSAAGPRRHSHLSGASLAPEDEREVAKRVRRRRAHGLFPSRKAGTGLSGHLWFSEAELDCMHLLEADPFVRRYRPRPRTFRLPVDGRIVEHTPSFLVSDGIRRVVLDVVDDLRSDDEAAQRAASTRERLSDELRRLTAQLGAGYQVWPLSRVRMQPRFANACELVRFISVDPLPEDEIRAADAIVAAGGQAERAAVEAALGGEYSRARLYALALAGFIWADMGRPFSDRTALRLLPRDAGRP